jgi:hypothetical protein
VSPPHQSILVGNGQHLLRRHGVLHGELPDQGRVPESLLEEHDDGFVVDLRYDVSLVATALDNLLEELSHLLYNAGQVLIDSWSCANGPEVVGELPTLVRP